MPGRDSFARYTELVGKGLKRHGITGKPPRPENAPLARIENAECTLQRIEPVD
jgi:hypothetical protein